MSTLTAGALLAAAALMGAPAGGDSAGTAGPMPAAVAAATSPSKSQVVTQIQSPRHSEEAAPVASESARQLEQLLQQVRIGEATYNPDLTRGALARLRMIAPDDPAVLFAELHFALGRRQFERAQQLRDRVCALAPKSTSCAHATTLLRLAGPDSAKLQQADLLLAAGNNDQALATFRQLFGSDPPDFELAARYWTAFGGVPGGRSEAVRGLQTLDRRYPGNAQLRQTLVRFLFGEDRPAEALQILGELATDPGARGAAAQTEFNYLSGLSASGESIAQWQHFLHRYPGSPLASEARQNLETQQQRMQDPAWRAGLAGEALLRRGDNPAAAKALRQALARYPDEQTFSGNLGYALMRMGDHAGAVRMFSRALALEQNNYHTEKWRTLIADNRYWTLLGDADTALERRDYADAAACYADARRLEPERSAPLLGLARSARGEGDEARAKALLLQVHQADPTDTSVIRDLVSLFREQGHLDRALALLESLPPAQRQDLTALTRSVHSDDLERQVKQATAAGEAARAIRLLEQVRVLQPDDPWVAYRLALAEAARGHTAAGNALFPPLLAAHPGDPQTVYSYALYLASLDRDQTAVSVLQQVPVKSWTGGMQRLDARLRHRLLMARARALKAAGHDTEAEQLLLDQHDSEDELIAADWVQQRGDFAYAGTLYHDVLAHDPSSLDAGLGLAETLLAAGELGAARRFLQDTPPQPARRDYNARRRLGNLWFALGDMDRAGIIFDALDQDEPTDPVVLRDSARVAVARGRRQHALDLYSRAMSEEHLIRADQAAPQRDDEAVTRASRFRDGEGWLQRSLRGDVNTLYQATNPTVTLSHDYGWRSDSTTPGISDLQRNTSLLQGSAPIAGGRGFLLVERVAIDAGRFRTGSDGLQHEEFGTCALQWQNINTGATTPAGCPGVRESDLGYAFAAGWKGQRWAFDFGHSPLGFTVGNWLGGASYSGDWSEVGYTLTLSRRPLDNTLLSYAGVIDPRTGSRYGGVTANGSTVGLSYDRGGSGGVWGELQEQRLLGQHILTNTRFRAMGGYYYRIMDRADEAMRIGVTIMYWNYQRNLGQYTLAQGGYYSPQQYYSIGVPFRWSWRSSNWSLNVESSLGWSFARFSDAALYPADVLQRIAGPGANPVDYRLVGGSLVHSAGNSNGIGVHVMGRVERRLSNHWVLGAQLSYYHSQDFAPSDALLYLRYTFNPWQGDLPLPVEPLTPYSDSR